MENKKEKKTPISYEMVDISITKDEWKLTAAYNILFEAVMENRREKRRRELVIKLINVINNKIQKDAA